MNFHSIDNYTVNERSPVIAQTPSTMIRLGTSMPPFNLPDCRGNQWSPASKTAGTLVVFICNHCPFVIHVAKTLVGIHALCNEHNIEMVGINSNDIDAYPDDAPDNMIETAHANGWQFPYLFDASQQVARDFSAACTPDVFLYDGQNKLFYRGQIDESRPSNSESDGKTLKDAIQSMVSGEPSPTNQKPAIGCNIKWK
jgi:peroxiredoxin